jgi:NAD-dependent deacetylase|nr:Sir2 family NAD-dependent protein deacetylase [Kofleriaceae bacterium]
MRARDYRRIVVLTGAGISRSAGLATYRGPGGLWSDREVAALAQADALRTRRDDACAMFWRMRRAIAACAPTPAHRALAAFERAMPADAALVIVTQNVDGLHQAAGSRTVVEYHGSVASWTCSRCGVHDTPDATLEATPRHCGEAMRPDAVLFGEDIPAAADHAVTRALRDCDLFVAIGTSGTVWPASRFVRGAAYAGAHTALFNLEAFDDARDLYATVETGPADELVPRAFALS